MKAMLVALVWAVAAVPAVAEEAVVNGDNAIFIGDWTYVGNSDTTVMFMKPGEMDGPYYRVFVRFEDGVPFVRDGFQSLASFEVDDVDCAAGKTRILESVRYARRNMTGDSHQDPIKPEWKAEAPGSFGAGLLAKVCATKTGG
jgi:hypothetical protein